MSQMNTDWCLECGREWDEEPTTTPAATEPVCEHNHTVRHTYAHIPQGYDECSLCGATRVEGKDWRTRVDHPECDHLMKWGTHDENGCSLCSCLTAAPTEVSSETNKETP